MAQPSLKIEDRVVNSIQVTRVINPKFHIGPKDFLNVTRVYILTS